MNQCKTLDKVQESFQFWGQGFIHEVIDKCVIDLPSQTMDRDDA